MYCTAEIVSEREWIYEALDGIRMKCHLLHQHIDCTIAFANNDYIVITSVAFLYMIGLENRFSPFWYQHII